MRAISVTAIIPAFNEEKTIAPVLETLKAVSEVNRIIVVSDGSTDGTVEVANQQGVEVIDLETNLGKGGAIKAGLDITDTEILLFLDADLVGLTSEHVRMLLEPVMQDRVDMTVGLFEKGRMATDFAQKVTPFLSGQRALKKEIIEDISDLDITRFGVEYALHNYAEESKLRTEEVVLADLSHIMKEEKMGLWKGSAARFKMYWEIIRSMLKLNNPQEK